MLPLDVILVFVLLMATFFFFSKLYFLRVFLKIQKKIFSTIQTVYFLYDQLPKLLTLNIDKEYAFLFCY